MHILMAPSTAQQWSCVLRVTDDDGNTAVDSTVVTVETRAPIAQAAGDTTVGILDSVLLTGSGSSDESKLSELAWKCGTGDWFSTETGDTVLTAPDSAQSWLCSLRVTDDDGNS